MISPIRYGKRKFRAGGTSGSVFSLVAATLGSGTISFPYAVMMNGYILGPILIVLGATLSHFTGMLIVKAAEKTGRTRYEDIALAIYGKRVARITSYLMLLCLTGFTFSYVVYFKNAVPAIIEYYLDEATKTAAPEWILNNEEGKKFWGLLFAFLILFPMSIPRTINALRFTSLIGVICSMYLALSVTAVFFTNRDLVPSMTDNFKKMEAFKFSYKGVITSFPLIIFAYMY